MERILGIDYGESRTGVAITDELGITAQGLETIKNQGSDKIILKRISEIVIKYNVKTLAIGYPINMDGTESERSKKTEEFIHKLKSRFNDLKIEKVDERLTTVEAHKTMNYLNIKNKKKKDLVDTIAAVYILESYINSNRN